MTLVNWLLQMAQIAAMWVTPCRRPTTCFSACMRGCAPLTLQLHEIVGQQAAAAAATESALADGIGSHVDEVVAAGLDDGARDLELPARRIAHARTARHVAGIVERDRHVVVGGLVQVSAPRSIRSWVNSQMC